VLLFANQILSRGALFTLAAILLGLLGGAVGAYVFDDPSMQLPPVALLFVVGFMVPGVAAVWLVTRSRIMTQRAASISLIALASTPAVLGTLNSVFDLPHLASMFNGAMGMYMMVLVSMTALLLSPRLSFGVGLWCATQYLVMFGIARPLLTTLSGPQEVTAAIASWGEAGRHAMMIGSVGGLVALFGVVMRRVLAQLIDQERRREAAERENVQREAKQALLQANSEAKSAFVATMSHELRTPMNAILGHAQHLELAPELSSRSRDGVRTILSSSRHLLELISEALDTAAIEAGRVRLSMGPVAPRDVVKGARDMLRPQASEKGLTLTTAIDQNVPLEVVSDEKRLRQVLTNLVGNAIKFTEAGYVSLHLRSPQPEVLVFVIEDTGVGIPADRVETIFDRFERVEHDQQGSGLGLAITRQLVDAMGGTIELTSVLGEGTRVEVRLPSGVHAPPDTSELSAYPNATDAEWLLESALLGDMQEVARRARELADRAPKLSVFSARVCALAEDFEDQQLLELLQTRGSSD